MELRRPTRRPRAAGAAARRRSVDDHAALQPWLPRLRRAEYPHQVSKDQGLAPLPVNRTVRTASYPQAVGGIVLAVPWLLLWLYFETGLGAWMIFAGPLAIACVWPVIQLLSGSPVPVRRCAEASRWLRRRRAERIPLRDVARTPLGRFCRVSGRVRARGALAHSALNATPGVFRLTHVWWQPQSTSMTTEHLVCAAGADFDLVGDDGASVRIQVAGADLTALPRARRLDPPLDAAARAVIGRPGGVVAGGETVIRDGDEIEIFGVVDAVVDPKLEERLARDTPLRPALRSAPGRPLQIVPPTSSSSTAAAAGPGRTSAPAP